MATLTNFNNAELEAHERLRRLTDTSADSDGEIEAALDAIRAEGVERLAFDLEGVLVAEYTDPAITQLCRKHAQRILDMTAEKMPETLIWTAALEVHAVDVIQRSGLVVPRNVDLIHRDAYATLIDSPRDFFSEADREYYLLGVVFESLLTDGQFVEECCDCTAANHGRSRLIEYCGLPKSLSSFEIFNLLNDNSFVQQWDLGGIKGVRSWSELVDRIYKRIAEQRCKIPQDYDVDLIFDDTSSLHRATNILLGNIADARKFCHVPKFEAEPPNRGVPGVYRVGDRRYSDVVDYFRNDTSFIAALRDAPRQLRGEPKVIKPKPPLAMPPLPLTR